MASTVQATVISAINATETFLEADLPSVGGSQLSYSKFATTVRLTATSTPPISKVYSELLTASQNLDLTALVRSIGGTIDCTGLKVQAIKVNNLSIANMVTIADGDATPYQLQGGQSILIQAGGKMQMEFNDKLADISGSVKVLKITATAGQTYQITILMG